MKKVNRVLFGTAFLFGMVFLLGLFVSASASGDGNTATIRGIAKDTDNHAMGDTEMHAVYTYNLTEAGSTTTDELGQYTITVAAGTYTVYPFKDGYYPSVYMGLPTIAGSENWINFTLQQIAAPSATIRGYVTSSGQPIADVMLFISGTDTSANPTPFYYDIATDNSGYYSISVCPGIYTIDVYNEGYESLTGVQVNGSGTSGAIIGGEAVQKNITINTVSKNIVIQGYALSNSTLLGIANVNVDVRGYDRSTGYYYDDVVITNATGYYTVNVAPGDYYLQFEPETKTYQPDYALISDVSASTWCNITLIQRAEPNILMKGYVKDAADSTPLGEVYVFVYGTDINGGYYYNNPKSDGNGYYEMKVPAGTFSVEANRHGYYWNSVGVTISSDMYVNISLEKIPTADATLQGFIKNTKTNKGVDGANIYIEGTANNGGYYSVWGETDKFGHYEISVMLGDYTVYAGREGYLVNETPINIQNNFTRLDILITPIPEADIAISGRVVDSENAPVSNAWVAAWTNDPTKPYYTGVGVESDGSYVLNVPAGTFEVHSGAFGYYEESFTITVEADTTLNITLKEIIAATYTIQGYVKNAENGGTLENAKVGIWGDVSGMPFGYSDETDAQGKFELKAPNGVFEIGAYKEGYLFNSRSITVNGNTTNENISLDPVPSADKIVTIKVVNKTGVVIIDANVAIWSYEGIPYGDYGTTNSTGYVVLNAIAGEFVVGAHKEGYFYNETQISVSGNVELTLILEDLPARDISISGYVLSTSGAVIPNADVGVCGMVGTMPFGDAAKTDATGHYTLTVPAGNFQLGAGAKGYNPIYMEINVQSNMILNITLEEIMNAEIKVSGYVKDSVKTTGISGAYVEVSGMVGAQWYWDEVTTNTTGYYSIQVPVGSLDIYVCAEGYHDYAGTINVKKATYYNITLKEMPSETSTVSGYVRDVNGVGITSADVFIYTENPTSTMDAYGNHTYTDANGYYTMKSRSGTFKIGAYKEGYMDNVTSITLQSNTATTQNIILTKIATADSTVSGYVKTQTGIPIPYAEVGVFAEPSAAFPYGYAGYTITDDTGAYTINVPVGTFTIGARAPNYGANKTTLTISSTGSSVTKDLVLKALPSQTSIIKGYVKDSNNEQAIINAVVYTRCDITTDYPDGYGNMTFTNEVGYYEMSISMGTFIIGSGAYDYDPATEVNITIIANRTTKWYNITLEKMEGETAVVKGYVNDTSGKIVSHANVYTHTIDYTYGNSTEANESGFYLMNIKAGDLIVGAWEYGYPSVEVNYSVAKNGVVWVNLTLEAPLPENVIIKGYVNDTDGNIISSPTDPYAPGAYDGAAGVYAYIPMGMYGNSTSISPNGYYEMSVQAGHYMIGAWATKYPNKEIEINLTANAEVWLNFTLEAPAPENVIVRGYVNDTNGKIISSPTDHYTPDAYDKAAGIYAYAIEGVCYGNSTPIFNGSYEMHLRAGHYMIGAWACRYPNEEIEINLTANSTIWLNFTLEAPAPENVILKGYVTDTNDKIISSGQEDYSTRYYKKASVYIYDFINYQYGNDTIINASGYYEMIVRAGHFKVGAWAEKYPNEEREINLTANSTVWLNFTLEAPPPEDSIIKGFVNDTNGKIISSPDQNTTDAYDKAAGVYAYTLNGMYGNNTPISSNGYYEMNVRTGHFVVGAWAVKYPNNEVEINVTKGAVIWLNFTLEAPLPEDAMIEGYVMKEGGTPIANASVWIDVAEYIAGCYYGNWTQTNEIGHYEMNVRAGQFKIGAWADGCFENVSRIDVAPQSHIWRNITLESLPQANNVIIGIISDVDGQPIYDVKVSVFKEKYYGTEGWTGTDGSYYLDVPAGSFRLVAWKKGYYYEQMTIDIIEGVSASYNITLVKTPPINSVIEGVVSIGIQQTPVPGAIVFVNTSLLMKYHFASGAITGIQGDYRIEVPAGIYKVSAYSNDGRKWVGAGMVQENDIVQVDLRVAVNSITNMSLSSTNLTPGQNITLNVWNAPAGKNLVASAVLSDRDILFGIMQEASPGNYTISWNGMIEGVPAPPGLCAVWVVNKDDHEILDAMRMFNIKATPSSHNAPTVMMSVPSENATVSNTTWIHGYGFADYNVGAVITGFEINIIGATNRTYYQNQTYLDYQWNTFEVLNSAYRIEVVAFDNQSMQSAPGVVNVTVDNPLPPTSITIIGTAPGNNATDVSVTIRQIYFYTDAPLNMSQVIIGNTLRLEKNGTDHSSRFVNVTLIGTNYYAINLYNADLSYAANYTVIFDTTMLGGNPTYYLDFRTQNQS